TGYSRMAHPYDFYSLRYVFAGAERVRDETRRAWMEKFGLRILEGYGTTETAPVLAINTPMQFKAGSVGRFLPGIDHRLDAVPGIERGGRLKVRGPNVMLGYLRVEAPGELEPLTDGWYDTGDIVDVDAQGFFTILGRVKRFAKIAGEMVSLGAVEQNITRLWPDHHHAVVALPDGRKGEQLILVTDCPAADRDVLMSAFRSGGLSDLMLPKTVLHVDHVPLLGSGKTDYGAVTAIAREALAEVSG
ncbi:MAG: AMP-binding protein, partial [Rhodospirillales bacterium]|nr:AMP-binding protein [Rhodospirillales bacterium]